MDIEQSKALEEYEEVYRYSVEALASLGADDPDLTPLRDAGGKLILSHGACDQSTRGTPRGLLGRNGSMMSHSLSVTSYRRRVIRPSIPKAA